MSNFSPSPANRIPLDGREESPKSTGPRYLHYRLYHEDGAIESRNPAYSNDRLVGRILSKAVTPPHTAASVISHLCKIEGFAELQSSSHLYMSLQNQTALEGSAHLALMSPSGPGSSDKGPMVLLIKNAQKRSHSERKPQAELPENPANDTHYLYYRFYSKDGESASKTSFDVDDPALGRINTLFVPPPFNVASLKARLARVEGKVGAKKLQICLDLSSDKPMNNNVPISLFTDHYPGFTAENSIAFVCLDSAAKPVPEPSRGQQAEPPTIFRVPQINTRIKFKAVQSFKAPWGARTWLSTRYGEILLTDGILRSRYFLDETYPVYIMTNSAGKHGYVWSYIVTEL